ncbi:N-methyltryptophan oxidase [Maioricimonas rarisocia]|uniref:N-methyltryptophan oxidase n=1 Tax=Maioricimonas rarisocia TaxID=2528026 RepID=A0A517Z3A8_9PLAN|nr:TIGR03364 family FAD-dependent oxidoreductase [Maioricimonas rarisocia]QDU36955.1 N-methyltryptophan oxidase [Maioricimonas rarisocia]
MKTPCDIAVIGAGILGLAHAWTAAKRGLRVALFERSPRAIGASIRNFGMIWPIGQPEGSPRETALLSRARWLELRDTSGLWVNECGSIHLAYRPDELAVLEEFASQHRDSGDDLRMLSRDEVIARSPAANPEGLLGGLWSGTELCVNPRTIIGQMPEFLHERYGVELQFLTPITKVDGSTIIAADGRTWQADRTIVCSGSDFETLFPETFREAPLKLCKLQMLRTPTQPDDWRIGPHLAGGLTLRHYTSFRDCPSLPALCERIERETPELNRYGIHVMASQNDAGHVILGDSHEYDDDISPFDRPEIDDLILRELRRMIRLPDWSIAERWHGIYAKYSDGLVFEAEPQPGVNVVVAPGGAGMTLSFGLAEQQWMRWAGPNRMEI